ncbi:PR5-like receptor kinase [Striga asiatica]|uniref:PR5-like receptor kinase n=1 Tax=Striga asiatica TaxID=4170 RepID=A0A5A7P2T8_STRAF|nr:PR5-like receptor kinase [Striga asiatica]
MPIRYSYKDIKKMTSGFRDKLGQGGYGSVYKGKLRSGQTVAIKLLHNKNSRDNGQDFINEIASIGRIHHVNVVKLVGYYAGRLSNRRALVFDFMPNGSLERYIFTRPEESQNLLLSWEKKYEIAIGVAKGIEYLHRGCNIQILHFDIKPHNILLDENFTPKISDFGLARLYATDENTVTLTAARGTIGYVAPELINRTIGGVSYKADVYSFGMLLMEMVGMNRNITRNDQESSQYFPHWIYDWLDKGKDIETGDAEIECETDEQGKGIVRKMTVVGLWCIRMSPTERPSMSEVVKMLESSNIENPAIPPRPFESTQIVRYSDDGSYGMESTGYMTFSVDASSIETNKDGN